MMRIKVWHCIALLFMVVFVAYSFCLQAGFNSIDDLKRVNTLDNAGSLDVIRLFFARGRSYYYRPLSGMTFFLDRELWGSIASFMHLENMLIHFLNSVMVFFVTRRISRYASPFVALVAALIFALHPLATEPVCWVSGRFDLMACFFLLLTVWFILLGIQERNVSATLLSGIALLLACLSKEIAVFVLPGMLWLEMVAVNTGATLLKRLRAFWLSSAISVGAVMGYFVMRYMATGHDVGIKTAVKGFVVSDYDIVNMIRVAFKVYGFYFKKLFLPWPLNFSIVNISGWYVIFGMLLTGVLLWLAWRKDIIGAFGLMSFCVLSPALLVVFGKMAWTPIAERYLYSSIAFVAPAISLSFFSWREKLTIAGQQRTCIALSIILLLFFSTTLHRVWIWQDNERLFRDTVAKSPQFAPARSELATALINKGRTEEAVVLLKSMQMDGSPNGYVVDDFNLAGQFLQHGELEQARELLLALAGKNKKQEFGRLQLLIKVNNRLIAKSVDSEEQSIMRDENFLWLAQQQKIRPSAFTLYRMGKACYVLNKRDDALKYLNLSLKTARHDVYYYSAAEKIIAHLNKVVKADDAVANKSDELFRE